MELNKFCKECAVYNRCDRILKLIVKRVKKDEQPDCWVDCWNNCRDGQGECNPRGCLEAADCGPQF